MASPTNVRKGKVLNYQGAPHLVLDVQHRTQGRQAGFIQVSMRNLNTGSSTNTKIRTTDSVEILHTDMVKLEYSYADGDGYHFMEPETFEDILIDPALVEDVKDLMAEEARQYCTQIGCPVSNTADKRPTEVVKYLESKPEAKED